MLLRTFAESMKLTQYFITSLYINFIETSKRFAFHPIGF